MSDEQPPIPNFPARRREQHRLRQTPEYGVWHRMRQRCHDSTTDKFEYYGGRGIRVCARWRTSFTAFIADMGRRPSARHSLDRIDNEGNYEPGNCRWVPWEVQRRNRRDVTLYFGRLLVDWAKLTGIPAHTMSDRMRYGWSSLKAIVTPVSEVYRANGRAAHGR